MHLVKTRGGVHLGTLIKKKRNFPHIFEKREVGTLPEEDRRGVGTLLRRQVDTYARTGQERWAPWVKTGSGKVGKRWAPYHVRKRLEEVGIK